MQRSRVVLVALAPVLVHALARETDRALGLILRAQIEPAGLLRQVALALQAEGAAAGVRVACWIGVGAVVWFGLGVARARASGLTLDVALQQERGLFAPLYLRPVITVLALVSVAVRPTYPYGFTLPVALTQDWAAAQDALTLAAVLALRMPRFRLPAPRASEVLLVSFLGYALLAPDWARVWEGHPGNEPKYLRQAVALGLGLTFDAEGVSAAMEDLPARPLGTALGGAAETFTRESVSMVAAITRGVAGRDAIRAQRITRQTIRGKNGGVYYVLAPGPSLMLAATLRIDRALNRARGMPGRVAVTLLAWNALAALLVAALFRLVRGATGREGTSAVVAFLFALVPPFLFYFFQFYPEMPAALVLTLAFETLALRPERLARHPWMAGTCLATLPWLHQKFLPVWGVLTATALAVAWREASHEPTRGGAGKRQRAAVLGAISVPQLATLYLTALYNFAITGSVRPDALFLAWGPGGVTSERVGQGVFGLLLDARYGILPYVPVFLLAFAGFVSGGARRFAVVIPSAIVYYLTVASADNWAGAVCNLGRYVMPVAPLAVALAGMVVASSSEPVSAAGRFTLRRGGVVLVLALTFWTALLSLALWLDPHAANDSARLLASSAYADGNQYIPNLFIRHWADAAPGLWARLLAWAVGIGMTAWAVRRASSPLRAVVGAAALILAAAFLLERWPAQRSAPSFGNALPAGGGAVVFLDGRAQVNEGEAIAGPGRLTILRRKYRAVGPAATSSPLPLRATVGGTGVLRVDGLAPIALRPTGAVVDLPVSPYHEVAGRDGNLAMFERAAVDVSGPTVLRFTDSPMSGELDGPGLR